MAAKSIVIAIVALASGVVLAQQNYQRTVKFGDELVTLKFGNASFDKELQRLWDATAETTDPVEQERLWRVRWEDYGESVALQSLANYHLERGDLVSGYAHLYAVDQLAKWYQSVVTTDLSPAAGRGEYHPPGPLLRQHFAEIEADLMRVGEELTASQRRAGIKLAASLVRSNPNCCSWP